MPRSKKVTKKSKQRLNRLKKNAKRLAAYSAATAATIMTTQRGASAQHVKWDIADVTVGPTFDQGLFFNMDTGGVNLGSQAGLASDGLLRLYGKFAPGATSYPHPYLYGQPGFAGIGTGFDNASRLTAGALINSLGPFVDGSGGANAFVDIGDRASWGAIPAATISPSGGGAETRGFVGVTFQLGGNTHYGWVDVTRTPGDVPLTARLHAFGYNSSVGAASIAGVPEPSSVMLLAAGAAGIGMFRRRRKAA